MTKHTHADTKQLCFLAIFIGAALLLVGCGGGGADKPVAPTGCTFDASQPQDIKASYMLAWKRGMNTSAVNGSSVTYIGDSEYDVVSDSPPLRFPKNEGSVQQWIASTKESITSGINVQLQDGGLLKVNGISSKTLADEVEASIMSCAGTSGDRCKKGDRATIKTKAALWLWTVRVKNNCGVYWFNISSITTEDESNPPCCLPCCTIDGSSKCEPDVEGKVYNLCSEAGLQIQV